MTNKIKPMFTEIAVPSTCDVVTCRSKPTHKQHLAIGFAETEEQYHMPAIVFLCEKHSHSPWNRITAIMVWDEVSSVAAKNGLTAIRSKSDIITEPID